MGDPVGLGLATSKAKESVTQQGEERASFFLPAEVSWERPCRSKNWKTGNFASPLPSLSLLDIPPSARNMHTFKKPYPVKQSEKNRLGDSDGSEPTFSWEDEIIMPDFQGLGPKKHTKEGSNTCSSQGIQNRVTAPSAPTPPLGPSHITRRFPYPLHPLHLLEPIPIPIPPSITEVAFPPITAHPLFFLSTARSTAAAYTPGETSHCTAPHPPSSLLTATKTSPSTSKMNGFEPFNVRSSSSPINAAAVVCPNHLSSSSFSSSCCRRFRR